jgi:hypothetical protein
VTRHLAGIGVKAVLVSYNQIKEDTCAEHVACMDKWEIHIQYRLENLNARYQLRDIVIDSRIISKSISDK